ncbi:MAG: TonB-dependent receptor plug domain-containing protein, partial [Bacteroidota bacterium]
MFNPVARLCLLPVVFILHLTTTTGQVDMDVLVYESSVKNPVSGIYVTLTNTSIGYKFTSVSDNQGKTVFRGLPLSGSYELSVAESDSFYASVLPEIMLFSQTSASVTLPVFRKKDLTLPEFTVGGASRVNARNAEVSSVLRQEELAQLPVEGRDVTRALYRLPNIVQATGFYPEAPNVGINGANSLYTNYMIDGMDNNEQFLGGMKFNIPVGFVRDIRALTNNFSAEYGQTGNGVINISSRSG